ncbi:MAG TPA: orotidine 5'-phosphate decarboxylase / HUMPS family protein, partial [Methylocystis sp.]
VARRARQAKEARVDGLILSPVELTTIRPIVGSDMLLVTPGVRPEGADAGDQKRIMTPREAIAASADYIVVGRPITRAANPVAAAAAVINELAGA